MLGRRGMTWLRANIWLLIVMTALWPAAALSADSVTFVSTPWPLSIMDVTAQTPMEAQMLGDRPFPSQSLTPQSHLKGTYPSWGHSGEGSATLRLPQNFRISFRYNSDKPAVATESLIKSPLLFKYSMDYCLLPNLRVGLNGFLYQPPADHLTFLRQQNNLLMGWGTSLNYDLGRWSFTFQSQVDKGRPEEGKDIQSWFRVWYAF